MPTTPEKIEKTLLALTLNRDRCPPARAALEAAFPEGLPQRGPEMLAAFELVDKPRLAATWAEIAAKIPEAQAFIDTEHAAYEARLAALPGRLRQAQTLGLALTKEAWELLRHGPRAAQKTARERLKICQTCPNLIEDQTRCQLCGCHVKAKTLFTQEQCPATPPRWLKVEPPPRKKAAPSPKAAPSEKPAPSAQAAQSEKAAPH